TRTGRERRRGRSALDLRPDDAVQDAHRRTCSSTEGGSELPLPPTARCGMTHEEILKGLYDNTLIGNAPEVKDLTNAGLEAGMDPESMLYDALIPSLEEVGARFERGDYFVPEMLIAAKG